MSNKEKKARKLIAKIAENKAGESVEFRFPPHFGNQPQIMQELSAALKENTTLKKLSLAYNAIDHSHLALLADALKVNRTLIELDLEENQIGDEGAKILADALTHHPSLQTISLKANQIGNEGAKSLSKMIEGNKHLQAIFLNSNPIGDVGAEALALSLGKNTTLKQIFLGNGKSGGDLGDKGAKAFANALKINKTLEVILFLCTSIEAEGAEAFMEPLRNHASLKHLLLQGNTGGGVCAKKLAVVLKENQVLEDLDICLTRIGQDGAKALTEALAENSVLERLQISYLRLRSGEAAKAREMEDVKALTKNLAEALIKNTTLEEIDLGEVGEIDAEGRSLITNALKKNFTITSISGIVGVDGPERRAICERNKIWRKPKQFEALVKKIWSGMKLSQLEAERLVKLREELSEEYKRNPESYPMRFFASYDCALAYIEGDNAKNLLLKALNLMETRQFDLSILNQAEDKQAEGKQPEDKLDFKLLSAGQIVFMQQEKSSQFFVNKLILKDHDGLIKEMDIDGLNLHELIGVAAHEPLTTEMLVAQQEKILLALHAKKMINQFNRENEGFQFLVEEVVHYALITHPLFIPEEGFHQPSAELIAYRNWVFWWLSGLQLGENDGWYANTDKENFVGNYLPATKKGVAANIKTLGNAMDSFLSLEVAKKVVVASIGNDSKDDEAKAVDGVDDYSASAQSLRNSRMGFHPATNVDDRASMTTPPATPLSHVPASWP